MCWGIKSRVVWSEVDEHILVAGMEFVQLEFYDHSQLGGVINEWEMYFERHGEYPQ